ncbi:E3 ubiquitin-protein ligase TRIM47 isoform X2 [Danio rerio]|uniref:E3 ubiquitin-protein ligase TRIM47 isoform X2 n=2 Tax=Danio rerio TaxID=7955 RepID=A0A8N7UVN8_DANRE
MAKPSVYLAQDQFRCSVCQDLMKDPAAIPCGHSYCMSCISSCWDQDEQKGVYSCPQCRQTFTPRPALGKNTMLTEVVENIRKRKLQAARPAQCYSESVDVECDVCTGRKYKAVKSCLVCLESYCQIHFEQHEEIHPGKRHKVTDATGRLQEMICPQHDRLLEMYCRTDQRCICMLCLMNEHKTHETVLPAEERAQKQKHLKESQSKLQQRIQERQKECEELRVSLETHKRSAQAAVEDTEAMFNELIQFIERTRCEVTQMIRDQEKAALSGAEGRLEQLEQEIDNLKRRNTELQQLSGTDHHIYFLQSFQSLSVPPGATDSSNISSHVSFGDFRKMVSQVKEKLQQAFKEEPGNISGIEKLEGSNESEQPGLQQLVYETTIQPTSVGRSEKQRYTQGQPRSIVDKGALHPHGSLVTSVK